MEPDATRIATRSRRQAMDWSLVLLSQGIEPTVTKDDAGKWELHIPARDSERAFKTLRQYRVENRGWPWQQTLPRTEMLFDWTCLVWAALLALFHSLSISNPDFKASGVMDAQAVFSGQWWRIFTAITLHGDGLHLASNLSIGVILLGLAMGRYGTGTGLFAAYLAGALGNGFSLLIHGAPFRGLGASGMVMGALGLLSAQTFRWNEFRHAPWKFRLAGVAAGLMLFALYGAAPETDVVAHFGGFVGGVLLGALLVLMPPRFSTGTKPSLVCAILLLATVALTWLLALSN